MKKLAIKASWKISFKYFDLQHYNLLRISCVLLHSAYINLALWNSQDITIISRCKRDFLPVLWRCSNQCFFLPCYIIQTETFPKQFFSSFIPDLKF